MVIKAFSKYSTFKSNSMTDAQQPNQQHPRWTLTTTAITGLIIAVTGVITFLYTRWDVSLKAASEIGELKADLKLHQNQLLIAQQSLAAARQELQIAQTELRENEIKLYRKTIDLEKYKEQVLQLNSFISNMQKREAALSNSLQTANNCRVIQKRIAQLEADLERSDSFGLEGNRRSDASQQLADHQISLRTCLASNK
ncbi:hypothetical protein ACVTTK_05430 [Alcaligenes nematophilus]